MIPIGFKWHLKGLHDGQPPVADFVNTVFQQLKEGKQN